MVSVSLLALCRVKDSAAAWPEEFAAHVTGCESNTVDRLPFGVLADWLDERGEGELAAAFRWLHKRPEVGVVKGIGGRDYCCWSLQDLPRLMGYSLSGESGHGFVGVVVTLADRLTELRKDLS